MSKTMQAVVFGGEGKWAVESVPVPSLQSDSDVLLKVDRVSICGTDIHIQAAFWGTNMWRRSRTPARRSRI